MTNDGWLDIIVGNNFANHHFLVSSSGGVVFANDTFWLDKIPRSFSTTTSSAVVGDVNKDGWLDIIIGNGIGHENHFLVSSSGGGVFANDTFCLDELPRSFSTTTSSAVLGDIHNDGWLVVIFGNEDSSNHVNIE